MASRALPRSRRAAGTVWLALLACAAWSGCISTPNLATLDTTPEAGEQTGQPPNPDAAAEEAAPPAIDAPAGDPAQAACIALCPAGGTCEAGTCVLTCPGIASCLT